MTEEVPAPTVKVSCLARRHEVTAPAVRLIPEETPVAFTYGGTTHAVMMATPADLEDFAIGFAITEGLIDANARSIEVEVVASDLGVELRSWLPGERQREYGERRRSMAGPTGCGLCGIESLEQATRQPPALNNALQVSATELVEAMNRLPSAQRFNQETRAVHGAAFWNPETSELILREDVKAARIGSCVIAAISAPTALAVRTADACGMTLVAVMRGCDFEIFTHPSRILEQAPIHVVA